MAENSQINNENFGGNDPTPITKDIQINTPPIVSSKDHQDITDSLRDATIQWDPNSKMDPDTEEFINAQAAVINKTAPLYPTRFTSPYPGNATDNRNPFAIETGHRDLSTNQGRRDFFSSIPQRAASRTKGTPHSGAWQNPIIYGKNQMNVDRYLTHPQFDKLGFHPYFDNETYYNQNSTAWDDLGRSTTAFWTMFKPAFTSGWRTLKNTLSGDPLAMDYKGAQAMKDAMRVASSSRGGVTGFMNDLYLNSAYTFGIVSSMVVEEAALALGTVATRGLSSHIAATRTAGNFKRLFDMADAIGTGARTVGNYSHDLLRTLGGTDKARKFYNYAKGNSWGARNARWLVSSMAPETTKALQTINSTKNTGKNLSNLAKINTTFGAFYRDIRMFNIAWAESRMEGGLAEMQIAEEEYLKMLNAKNGEPLTNAEWALIDAKSKNGGLAASLMNMPIIMWSNRIVLDGALRGFKPLNRALSEAKSGLGRKLMKTAERGSTKLSGKAYEDVGSGLKRVWKEGWKYGLGAAGAAALHYSSRNLAEGFQELGQEAVAAGVEEYYSGLFDQVISDGMDMNAAELQDRFDKTEGDILKAINAGLSGEGVTFETFMSGFLMGGIIQPFQTIMFESMPNAYRFVTDREKYNKYAKEKKKYTDAVISRLDEMWKNPAKFFDINKLNALNQRDLNMQMLVSSYALDVMSFKDQKDQVIFSHIFTMLETGKSHDFKAHIQAFLDMSDTELLDAFPESEATAEDVRKRFKGIVQKIDQMEARFNKFNDKYVNPYNENDYEEGSRIWAQEIIRRRAYDHAKMMFLFTGQMYERSVERMDSIVKKLASDPVVDKIAANDIAALTNRKHLYDEIKILRDETQVKPARNTSKEIKDQYKNKKEKLGLLEEFREALGDSTNFRIIGKTKNSKGEQVPKYGDQLKKSGKAKIKSIFLKYLNHIAKTSDGQIQDSDKVNEAFEMIIDHKALNQRAHDYWKASQILDNPDHLLQLADRSAIAMNKIWKEHRKRNKTHQRLTKFMDQQERGKIIADLARRGIYTDVESAEIFIKTGALTADVDWYSEESRINAITQADNPRAWKTLQDALHEYKKQKEAENQVKDIQPGKEVEHKDEDIERENLSVVDELDEGRLPDSEKERDEKVTKYSPRQYRFEDFRAFIASDPSTKQILDKKYIEYVFGVRQLGLKDLVTEDGQPLEFWDWVDSIHKNGGGGIVRARHKAHYGYAMQTLNKKNEQTFDEYLEANKNRQFLITIAGDQALKVSDILVDTVVNENRKLDEGIESNEELVNTGEDYTNTKIKIIKKTDYDDSTGQEFITYQILTLDNINAIEKYGNLPKAEDKLKRTYSGENAESEAFAAANWLRYNVPNQETFDFNTEEKQKENFTTGEIIEDKSGKKYEVKSTKSNVDIHGNLWVKPLDGGKNIYIGKGHFRSDPLNKTEWTRSTEKPAETKGKRKDKLYWNEPIQLYLYDDLKHQQKAPKPGEEGYEEWQTDLMKRREELEDQLQKMSKEDRDKLEVRIRRGEGYDEMTAKIKKDPLDLDKKEPFGDYPENKQLRKGTSKYQVIIYKNDKPWVVLQSPYDVILLDNKDKKIEPAIITLDQAKELFLGVTKEHHAEQIRINYTSAFLMEKVFEDLLTESNKPEASITIKELEEKEINLLVQNGTIARKTEDGQDAQSKLKDLKKAGYTLGPVGELGATNKNGEPYYLIIDQQRSKRTKERHELFQYTNIPRQEDEGAAYNQLRDDIDASMQRQGYVELDGTPKYKTQLGRYVTFVFSPGLGRNGEYTAIELKTDPKSLEDVQNLIIRIKDRMSETKEKNLKDDPAAELPVPIQEDYNFKITKKYPTGFNQGIADDAFIATRSGQHIHLTVTQYGRLRVHYYNSDFGFEIDQTFSVNDINTLTTSKEAGVMNLTTLFNFINKKVNEKIEKDKKIKVTDVKYQKGPKKGQYIPGVKLNIDTTKFRSSIPKDFASQKDPYEKFDTVTTAKIESYLRKNIRGTFEYTNSLKIKSYIDAQLNIKADSLKSRIRKTAPDAETATTNLEDEKTWDKIVDSHFKDIDENILKDIAYKLENEIGLSERENEINSEPTNSRIIAELRIEVKDETTQPNDVDLQKKLKKEVNLKAQLEQLEEAKYNQFTQERSQKTIDGKNNNRYISDEAKRRTAVLSDIANDPEVIELKTNIKKGKAFKIVNTEFDSREVEEWNVFDNYLKYILPEGSYELLDVKKLAIAAKNTGITLGAFLLNGKIISGKQKYIGQIYTSPSHPFKYHEAFHAVFRMLLTEEQIEKFLKIGKKGKLAELREEGKSPEQALKELRLMSPTYAEMSVEELEDVLWEEWLADQFDVFKMDPKKSTAPSEVKSWYSWIIELFRSIFEKLSPSSWKEKNIREDVDNSLVRLFEDIDSGKFKSSNSRIDNRFTNEVAKSSGGISSPAWAILPKEIIEEPYQIRTINGLVTKYLKIVIPFDQNEVDLFIKRATALYVDLKNNFKSTKENPNVTTKELLKKAVDMITAMSDPGGTQHNGKSFKEINRITIIHNALKSNRNAFINSVRDYVSIVEQFGDTIEEENDLAENEEKGTPYDINAKRNQMGGFRNVNDWVRMFIMSTSVEEKDINGNKIIINPNAPKEEQITLKKSSDYIQVFTGLLKSLSGVREIGPALKKMYIFSETNEETRSVVNNIFTEFFGPGAIGKMEDYIEGISGLPEVIEGKENDFNKIMKAFYTFRVDYVMGLKDTKTGNTNLFAANKQDDEHWQLRKWKNLFNRLRWKIGKGSEGLKKLIDSIELLEDAMKSGPLETSTIKKRAKKIANDFRNLLGIELSPKFIEYSIVSAAGAKNEAQTNLLTLFKGERPITLKDELNNSDLVELKRSLNEGENLYNEYDNNDYEDSEKTVTNHGDQTGSTPDGIYYRLQKWAISNAAFDETVGSTVMLDPEGNYIYTHQTPTYHLEMAEQMNTLGGLDALENSDDYYKDVLFFNDPKFRSLSEGHKLRILRMLGTRSSSMIRGKDGRMRENMSLDINKIPGKTFGNFTQTEFIANLLNMYALNYSDQTGAVEYAWYEDPVTGDKRKFAFSPVLLRVLSDANIADFQNLPIIKVLGNKKTDGNYDYEQEFLDHWIHSVRLQYNRIQQKFSNLTEGIPGKHLGYDRYQNSDTGRIRDYSLEDIKNFKEDPTQARAYKFGDVKDVLTIRRYDQKIKELDIKSLKKLTSEELKDLVLGEQSVFLKSGKMRGLSSQVSATVEIEGLEYEVRYDGKFERKDLTVEELLQLKDQLGNQISNELSEASGFTIKRSFTIKGKRYFAKTTQLARFFKGQKDSALDLHTIVPFEKAERQKKSGIFDNSLLTYLEEQASKTGDEVVTFGEALAKFQETDGRDIETVMSSALDSQYVRFEALKTSLDVDRLIDTKIKKGFKEFEGGDKDVKSKNKKAIDSMDLMHINNDADHNFRQIFFSNWLQTHKINKIYLKDQAISLKDAVDMIKRAKMQNAGGANAESMISNPKADIHKPVKEIKAIVFTDPPTRRTRSTTGEPQKPGQRTDGQVYMTLKAFTHVWFGIGELTDPQIDLINKIKNGKLITKEEFFGAIDKDSIGYKQNKAYINSKKFVYGDGSIYLKMSAFVLTKGLILDSDGTALPSRKKLFNLMNTLEKFEKDNDTIMMAVPASASKMRKTNILDRDMTERLFGEGLTIGEKLNISTLSDGALRDLTETDYSEGGYTNTGKTLLDAVETLPTRWLRLQQVTPSGKIEVIDPRQIKNIILNEQNDATIVILNGEEISIGEIKAMYQFSISQRLQLNYLNRTSLIFDLPNALNEIEKAAQTNTLTPDLESFLDYATAALQVSQSSTQNLEFFSKLKNGESKYELNNPITIQRFTELMMSFFGKGVMSERQPGTSVVLVSDYGMDVIKKVDAIDENGTPIAWTVIRTDDWRSRKRLWKEKINDGKGILEPKENEEGNLTGLAVDQIYVDRLRHDVIEYKRNDEGKLIRRNGELVPVEGGIFSEFMLPPHVIEAMDLKPGEPIPDIIAKQFGVRIPSQDKHSAVNLKLVDFLPVEYGSSGVFSYELLEISGADFDIDKLYIHNKKFYKKDGTLREYGKGKTQQERFDDYMHWAKEEILKSGTTLNFALKKWRKRRSADDSEIEKTPEQIEKEYGKWVLSNTEALALSGSDPKLVRAKFAEEKGYDYNKKDNEFWPKLKELDTENKKEIAAKGALNILKLPHTKKLYEEFRESNKKEFKLKDGRKITLYKEPYAPAHSNNILDFKIAMLGNNSMAKAQPGRRQAIKNEPAVDDPFANFWNKKVKDDLPVLYEKNRVDLGYDPNNILAQAKFFNDSQEGSRNIGAVVLPNQYLGWHKQYKTELRITDKTDKEGKSISLPRFNGHYYYKYGINYFIDPKTGEEIKTGDRLQYVMSALISIMVDNGTNPYAAKLGLNKHAASMVANGIALGINLETLLLLINNPVIVRNYFKANNKKNIWDKGIVKLIQDEYDDLVKDTDIKLESLSTIVTDPMMEKHINTLEGLEMVDEVPRQMNVEKAAILREFLNIARIKKANDNLANLAGLQTGMGRDLNNVTAIRQSIKDLGLNLSEEEYEDTLIPFDYKFVKKFNNIDNITGVNKIIFENYADHILPRLVVTASPAFNKIFNLTVQSLNPKIGPDQKSLAEDKIRKDLLSYLTIKSYISNLIDLGTPESKEDLASLSNALLYDEIDGPVKINKVIKDIKKILQEKGITNEFIEEYLANKKNGSKGNDSGIDLLETRPFERLDDSQAIQLQASFLELLKYEGIKQHVKTLIHYDMVKNGFQQRSGSYLKIIPPILLTQFLDNAHRVKDLLSEKFISQEREDQGYKAVFGVTFNNLASDFVTNYFKSSIDTHYVPALAYEKNKKNFSELYHSESEILVKHRDMIINVASNITPSIVRRENNKNKMYIVSDSIAQDGYHSHESLRAFKNVFSIPVMKDKNTQMTDEAFKENTNAIDEAIKNIEDNLDGVTQIIFTKEGIGTGIYYNLSQTAPKTKAYLDKKLKEKFAIINGGRELKAKEGVTTKMSLEEKATKKVDDEIKTTIVKRKDTGDEIDIKKGKSKLVKFRYSDIWYKVTNRGYMDINEAGGVDEMLESEGHESIGAIPKHLTDIIKFMEGEQKAYVYDIEKAEAPKQEMKPYDAKPPKKGSVHSPIILRHDEKDGKTLEWTVEYNTKTKYIKQKGKRRKAKKTKWEKRGQRWNNAEKISGVGIEFIETEERTRLGKAYPVIKMTFVENRGEQNERVITRYFELDHMYAFDTAGEFTQDVYSSQDLQNSLLATAAKYKEFVPLGSRYGWKGAFIFDLLQGGTLKGLPNLLEIKKNLELLKRRSTTDGNNLPENYQDDFDTTGVSLPIEKTKPKLEDSSITDIDATSEGLNFKKDGESVGNTSEQNVGDIISDNITPPSKLAKGTASLFSKAEGKGAGVTKKDMQLEGVDSGIDYSDLEAWFFDPNRTDQEIKKVATAMNLTGATLKDFINGFEKVRKNANFENYQVKDYVDRIKSCY